MKISHRAIICAITLSFAILANSASAQPGRGPGGRGPGGGPGAGGLDLLRSEVVQKELELVDDQIDKLRDLGEEMRNAMREVFQGIDFRNMTEEDRNALREKMREATGDIREKLEEILLPHQRERFQQLQLQAQMRGGTARALGSEAVREALGISEDQVNELREKAEQANRELNEKIQKLREEARTELLESVLSKEQLAKFEELLGEPFQFPQPQFGRGPGQGGGRGPGGGDGQGRRRGDGEGGRRERPETE